MIDAPLPDTVMQALHALLADGRRKLLGLAGAPGAGKSTLAQAIADRLGAQRAQVVPMDGFHLAQTELVRLGRAAGFVALLARLRAQRPDEVVYAPAFRREIEEPIAGAIALHHDTQLIVAEGNYLLLDTPPWRGVAALLDACWYVEGDEALRRERLRRRPREFGRSDAAARAWEAATDQPNAKLVAATRWRAHRVVHWPDGLPEPLTGLKPRPSSRCCYRALPAERP